MSLSEPDSVIQKEGWEIRWAKPIGVSKMMERQQHIREAVASSNVQDIMKSPPRKGHTKKRGAKALVKCEDEGVHLAQIDLLQNFIKERYNAICVFNCVPINNATKYVGKVTHF